MNFDPKRTQSVQATRLIHEYFGTLMAYVYSRPPLEQLARDRFHGEWKFLRRAIFEIPEERAIRALIELGLYIRVLDDDEKVSAYLGKTRAFGELVSFDGSREPLYLREVANKIIHADRYAWPPFTPGTDPCVVCLADPNQAARGYKWQSASIDLVALGTFCGSLMS